MRLTTTYHVLSLETPGPHRAVLSWPRCLCIALSDSQTVICNPINTHIWHKSYNMRWERRGSGPEELRTVNLIWCGEVKWARTRSRPGRLGSMKPLSDKIFGQETQGVTSLGGCKSSDRGSVLSRPILLPSILCTVQQVKRNKIQWSK